MPTGNEENGTPCPGTSTGDSPSPETSRHDDARQRLDQILSPLTERMDGLVSRLEAALAPTSEKTFLTIDDVARRWQCSRRHVENLLVAGDLEATYFGRARRFALSAVEAVEQRGTQPTR